MSLSPESARVFASLKEHGLLLQTDASLPNVCSLVTGAPVRGSWWAHPRSHDIFHVNCELAEHPEVLVTKLVSGKVTYLHRVLWPAVIAVGRAREPWQMDDLSSEAGRLLARVDQGPLETDRKSSKAATEIEMKVLVYAEQFHGEAGAHGRKLETWDRWMERTKFVAQGISSERSRILLEEVVSALNQKFAGRGRLPWR